ncbi:MAG: DUF805 domain-containing protein [Actinomycetota bacterium]
MKVTFIEAVRLGFVNFRNFKGTATRRHYWYFVLFTVLLGIVLSTIEGIIWPAEDATNILDAANQNTPLSNIAGLILLLPSLALSSRRLRDAGWSGKWLLLFLVPLIALVFSAIGLIGYLQQSATPEVEALAAAAAYFVPTLFLAIVVQVFLLVLCLLPTKTKEQGNRYAEN